MFLGYDGEDCSIDIDECKLYRNVCGRGICHNLLGRYHCVCKEPGKCGYSCMLENPCLQNPCEHGTCESNCTDIPDYKCICEENYDGKNCDEYKVNKLHITCVS